MPASPIPGRAVILYQPRERATGFGESTRTTAEWAGGYNRAKVGARGGRRPRRGRPSLVGHGLQWWLERTDNRLFPCQMTPPADANDLSAGALRYAGRGARSRRAHRLPRTFRTPRRRREAVRRLRSLSILPSGHLHALEGHADGQRRSRIPRSIPTPIIGDFSTPNPLVTFRKEDVAFTYGSKWKQRYFTKRGDDYFVFPAQWDVRRQDLAALLRRAGHRLVGRALSGRPDAAADRSAVRRLPLGELRHQDEDGHRVERRLREVPRRGQPARRVSGRLDDRQSREARRASAPTTSASSVTRRVSRAPSRSTASTTTGRSGISRAIG